LDVSEKQIPHPAKGAGIRDDSFLSERILDDSLERTEFGMKVFAERDSRREFLAIRNLVLK
jgi:hypothetical protein